jgi:hypothetical protein
MSNEKKDALATATTGALAPAPDYFKKNDHRGLEGTAQSDISIPRLALAQALSPQVTDGDPNRIEGLKVGDLFNSMTGQIYGREVRVQILRKMPLRAMEFNPIDEGGGVKRPNVPLNDPALQWGNSGNKKEDKPRATLFRDFIAVLLPSREMIALSFKSSGIKVAKNLWGLVIMRNRPVFAGVYRITTGVELQPKPHQVYKVENDGWVSQEDAALGEQAFEAVQNISSEHIDHNPEREPGDEDDFPGDGAPATEM